MLNKVESTTAIRAYLHRQWLLVTVSWVSVLLLGYVTLSQFWSYATRWFVIASLVSLYGLHVLWRGLPKNHRAEETTLLSTLGWGNHMSLLRGLSISLVAGFLFSPWPTGRYAWLPMLLYTFADIADYLDGYLARVTNHATLLGVELDIEFDGLGMLVVSLLAVWYGQLPWWYLSLGLARYLFVLGLWCRQKWNLPIYEIPPSIHRRLFAGFQMGFMSAVLWPIVPPFMATIAGTLFALPTALGFIRDWLVAIGWLNPAGRRYVAVQRWLYILMSQWVPVLLRGILAGVMGVVLLALPARLVQPAWVELFTQWHLPKPAIWSVLFIGVAWVGTATAVIGILTRLAAFWLVFPIGFDMVTRGLGWANGVALATVICLLLLGSGSFSLWRPEDKYLMQPAGQKPPSQGVATE